MTWLTLQEQNERDKLDAFFKGIQNFVIDCNTKYWGDFKQGFIRKSTLEYLFQQMLSSSKLRRPVSGEMYLDDYDIKFVNNKLFLGGTYFKVEPDDKLYTPFAIYLKNAQTPVLYFNYYFTDDGEIKFYKTQELSEIMTEYGLSEEEATEYERMLRQNG